MYAAGRYKVSLIREVESFQSSEACEVNDQGIMLKAKLDVCNLGLWSWKNVSIQALVLLLH